MEFSGGGKIKLAYNIHNAAEYDENTVYYVAAREIKSSYDQLDKSVHMLYKLDVQTNRAKKLLDIQKKKSEEESTSLSGFTIAMIFMGIAFFFAFIGFVTQVFGFAFVCLFLGLVAMTVGILLKLGKDKIKQAVQNFIKEFKS